MSDLLLLEKNGAVASITFNRPDKANALDISWLGAITKFLGEVGRDDAIRCIVIRGNGKHFMAGGDLESLQKMAAQPGAARATEAQASIRECNDMIRAMRQLAKPIVVAVQGGVAGSAVGLVGACDLVVAADNAFFTLAHVALGASNDGMTTYFLPRQVGTRKALEMALLGDRVMAAEAKDLGLVNFVVPAAELAATTDKLVARLCVGPTRAYGLIKKLMDASVNNTADEQGELESKCYGEAAMTADLVEGINAVLGKRAAQFNGR